jgi:lipid-binding SYLF domain-containing protein
MEKTTRNPFMRPTKITTSLIILCGSFLSVGCSSDMTGVLSKNVVAFRDIEASDTPIPPEILSEAKAVAIFSSTQAGLIFGGKGGDGVFVKRDGDGFSPPLAVDLIQGSVGLQVGAQNESMVYIFRTDAAVEHFLTTGRYAIAEAAGSFGSGSGSTDPIDLSEQDVLVFAQAKGLYGGVVVGGMGFKIDEALNSETYNGATTSQILSGEVETPHGTNVLWKILKNQN